MSRQRNEQIPFGELLIKARLDMGYSRAQLAKLTGIAENSLTRYEKAGLEKDGQFPPGPKLAKLCFELDISPLTAMLSNLTHEEYWQYLMQTSENWLMDHPQQEYLTEQYEALMEDNSFLRSALKELIKPEPKKGSFAEETRNWIISETNKIIQMQERFNAGLQARGMLVEVPSGVTIPGSENHWANSRDIHDYALMKNGSNHKDLNRSVSDHPKAVPAAPTQPFNKGKNSNE